jgi:hypothetical protein
MLMRLWNTLHTLVREMLAGRRRAGKKGVRPRSRLEVEGLDQRLLPSSFQWGMSQGVTALVQPVNPGQTPSYNVGAHETGAQAPGHIEVLSFTFGGTSGSPASPISLNFTKVTFTPIPTEQVSLNFAPPLHSFSWGEVG